MIEKMHDQKNKHGKDWNQGWIEFEAFQKIAPQQGNESALNPAAGAINPEHRLIKARKLPFFEPINQSRTQKYIGKH